MTKDLNKTKEQLSLELNDLRNKSKKREEMQEAANQQLSASEQQFFAFANNLHGVTFIKDTDLKYIFINKNFENTFDVKLKDWKGKTNNEIGFYPKNVCEELRNNDIKVINEKTTTKIIEEVPIGDKMHYWMVIKFPLFDNEKKIIAVAGIAIDITEQREQEQELKQALSQIEIITANVSNIIWKADIDKNGNFINTYISEVVNKFLALPAGTINNSWDKYFSYVKPEYLPLINEILKQAIASPGKQISFDYEVKKANGETAWFSSKGKVHVENNKLTAYGSTIDITESKKAEKTLQESEKKFREIIENARDIHYRQDFETGAYNYISPSIEHILGYTTEEIINMDVSQQENLFMPEDLPIAKNFREDLLSADTQGKGFLDLEFRLISKSNKICWMSGYYVLSRDSEGNPKFIVGILTDITERKLAEKALKESEQKYRSLTDTSTDVIITMNLDGKLTYINPFVEKLTGFIPKHFIGHSFMEIVSPESIDTAIEHFKKGISGDELPFLEIYIMHKDGSKIAVEVNASNLYGINGKTVGRLAIVRDITERKLAEKALKEKTKEAQLLADMLDKSSQPFAAGFIDGKLSKVNSAFCNLTGYSNEELLNDVSWNETLTPKEWREYEGELLQKVLISGEPQLFEKEYFHKSGKRISVELLMHRKVDDNNNIQYVYGFITDITERKQAEKALIDSESNLRQIIDLVPHFIFVKDEVGKFQIVNKAVADAYGVTVEDIKGKYDMDFASNKNDAAIFIKDDLEVINSGKQKFIPEEQITDSKGNIRFLETTKIPFNTSITEKRTILGVSVDITERKMSEERIKQQNIFLNHVLESLSHPFHVINVEDYTIELSNSALGEINVDQKPTCHKYAHNNDEPCGSFEHPCPLEIVKKTKKSCVVEHIHFDKNGEKINVEMQAYPIFDKAGNVVQMIEYSIDITERKKAENALKSSEDRLSIIFESAPDAYYMNDLKGSFIDGNKAAEELLGYKKEELIGKSFLNLKLISPQQTVLASKLLVKSLMGKPTGPDEFLLNRKDGSQISVEIRTYPVLIENKTVILGIARDITKRKQAEEENLKLSTAVTQSPSVIVITNLKGNIEYVNPKFTELTGYSFEEAKGENVTILRSYEQSDEIYKEFWGTISSGKTWHGEFHNKKKNGELFWEAASISPIFDKKGKIINYIKVAEDISERKRMEIVQQIIHNISNAVITTDNLDEFISIVRNELDRLIDAANFYVALYDEETDIFDLVFHKDRNDEGESFPAGKTLTAYVVKTKKPLLATKKVIKKLEKSGEVESFGVDAEVWLGVPLIIKGKIIGVYAVQSYDNEKAYNKSDLKMLETISHQISISLERKKNDQEMKVALERAQESDRLKSAFLTNMSHEIRTPMNGILGFTGLLKDPQLTGDEKEDYIQVIEKSGDRMLNTITDIIDISRIESGQVEVVNTEVSLNNILNEQYEIFNPDAQSKGLELNYKPTLSDKEAIIVTDIHKLEGILTNLIKNAIKFTKHGNISFGYSLKKVKNYEGLEFFVKDTGIGIPSNRISAIFNRFEQADIEDTQVFEGSGLGLAISKSYAEMLGGNISVTSEEGIGSTFVFSIPYTKPTIKERDVEGGINKLPQVSLNKLSVIVAEDDETSRMLLEAILENKFYKIIYTKTGKETVDKFRENPETSIILMDLKMHDMSGYEATREIRKFNQDVVIIAQTAYGLSGDREKAIEAGCNDYISKPFKKELLFEKIMLHLSKRSI